MASTALISGRARNREIAMDFPTLLPTLFPRATFYERTRSEYDERLGGSGVDQWVLRLPDEIPQHIWNANDILQGGHVGEPNGGDGLERKRERRRTACF